MNENLRLALTALVRKLLWPATNGRPDLCFDTSNLAASVSVAKIRDLTRANKLIRRLQFEDIPLSFPNLGLSMDWNKLVFTYASLSNVRDCGTQRGFLIFLVNVKSLQAYPLSWRSSRLRRIARSTLSAEAIACIEGADTAVFITGLLDGILNSDIPIFEKSDNLSLIGAVYSTK